MATIDISKSHSLGKEKAKAAAESIAQRLRDKIQISYQWVGDELTFDRSGAKGSIQVTDSSVRVLVDLGLMLRPMKSMIENKVKEYLEQSLVNSG